jgi:hypothetical protein
MRALGVALAVVISGVLATLVLPVASLAASKPQLGPLTFAARGTSATAGAAIKPEGLRTEYAFWLEGPKSFRSCLTTRPCAPLKLAGSGFVEAMSNETTVSAELTELQANQIYEWWVTARNAEGSVESTPAYFETSLPIPVNEGGRFEPEPIPVWVREAAAKWGREQVEAAERARRETSEREAREREARAAGEVAAANPAPQALQCVVPRLRDDSLRSARRALRNAHCRLGRVHVGKNAVGRLVVIRQGVPAGDTLAEDASVAITLGHRSRGVTRG